MSGRDERPIDLWGIPSEDRIHYTDIFPHGISDMKVTENPDEVTCPLCLAIMAGQEEK